MTRVKAIEVNVTTGARTEILCTPEEEAALIAAEAAAATLDRTALCAKIDAAVAAIYDRPMTYSKEYEQREAQAQAFKNAGYTGNIPARVAGFATPAGMTAQEATDLILQQAAQLRGALDQLSDLRMRKYELARAPSDAAAQASFDEIMAAIAAIGAAL